MNYMSINNCIYKNNIIFFAIFLKAFFIIATHYLHLKLFSINNLQLILNIMILKYQTF